MSRRQRKERPHHLSETAEDEKKHPDVEYAVDDFQGNERIFKTFDEAAAFALGKAIARGEADLDVLIWSEEGAEWYGGSDAVDYYNEDPEASVYERYNITVNNAGRVP
jgi:hypothetical protein